MPRDLEDLVLTIWHWVNWLQTVYTVQLEHWLAKPVLYPVLMETIPLWAMRMVDSTKGMEQEVQRRPWDLENLMRNIQHAVEVMTMFVTKPGKENFMMVGKEKCRGQASTERWLDLVWREEVERSNTVRMVNLLMGELEQQAELFRLFQGRCSSALLFSLFQYAHCA